MLKTFRKSCRPKFPIFTPSSRTEPSPKPLCEKMSFIRKRMLNIEDLPEHARPHMPTFVPPSMTKDSFVMTHGKSALYLIETSLNSMRPGDGQSRGSCLKLPH